MKFKKLKKLSAKERHACKGYLKRRAKRYKELEKEILKEEDILKIFRKKNKNLLHHITKAWEKNVAKGSTYLTISNIVGKKDEQLDGCLYNKEAYDLFVDATDPQHRQLKNVAVRYFKLRGFRVREKDEFSVYFGRDL